MKTAIVTLILGLFTLTPALAATAQSQTNAKPVKPAPAVLDSDQNGCFIPPVAV
jgi:hypothetical protein